VEFGCSAAEIEFIEDRHERSQVSDLKWTLVVTRHRPCSPWAGKTLPVKPLRAPPNCGSMTANPSSALASCRRESSTNAPCRRPPLARLGRSDLSRSTSVESPCAGCSEWLKGFEPRPCAPRASRPRRGSSNSAEVVFRLENRQRGARTRRVRRRCDCPGRRALVRGHSQTRAASDFVAGSRRATAPDVDLPRDDLRSRGACRPRGIDAPPRCLS
jgi:hypothetical protein